MARVQRRQLDLLKRARRQLREQRQQLRPWDHALTDRAAHQSVARHRCVDLVVLEVNVADPGADRTRELQRLLADCQRVGDIERDPDPPITSLAERDQVIGDRVLVVLERQHHAVRREQGPQRDDPPPQFVEVGSPPAWKAGARALQDRAQRRAHHARAGPRRQRQQGAQRLDCDDAAIDDQRQAGFLQRRAQPIERAIGEIRQHPLQRHLNACQTVFHRQRDQPPGIERRRKGGLPVPPREATAHREAIGTDAEGRSGHGGRHHRGVWSTAPSDADETSAA